MIGLMSAGVAGAVACGRLAAAWPERARTHAGGVTEAVRAAVAECEQLGCPLAAGAVAGLVEPLPGGHDGGAGVLADAVAAVPGTAWVVTTATDAVGAAGFLVRLPVEGDVAGVSRALLDREPVALAAEVPWSLPVLPPAPGGTAAEYAVRVTDRALAPGGREVVPRPRSLVVGVGASTGAPADEVLGLIEGTLRDAGLSARDLARLATVDTKATEPGVVAAAERLGVPLVTYSAGELAGVAVPNPSAAPLASVGTPSVAEAAALAGGGELLVPKRKSRRADGRPAMATCAVVRRPVRGRLVVVGLGPCAGNATVLPAGPGSTDPDAGAEVSRAARPLWEGRGCAGVETAVLPDGVRRQTSEQAAAHPEAEARRPHCHPESEARRPHFPPDEDGRHGHHHHEHLPSEGHRHPHAQ